ncbi:MAG: hypothetical protein QGH33_17735, partial [Pirellulaceae bacterium]|nr:hypothetical protein [Pirellulaceae bacterium]
MSCVILKDEQIDSILPKGSAPEPISIPHFPDRLHAFVWRNWQAVALQRLATVLGTSVQNVAALGASMGLPTPQPFAHQDIARGYITILRRNWHLLPYAQLLQLVDMSAEQLAQSLKEDDFLWIKLGQLKPRCEPLRYAAPGTAARERSAQIKKVVQRYVGDQIHVPIETRFEFIRRLSEPMAAEPEVVRQDNSLFAVRFIYSYFAMYGDPLMTPQFDPYPDGLLQRLAHVGVNGVWLHVVLRDLAPGGDAFPEFGTDHETRLATLSRLVERAGRHGVAVYLYLNEPRAMPASFFTNRPHLAGVRSGDQIAMCTTHPMVRQWISDAVAHVFGAVPNLGGVFTITASENLTNCASGGQHAQCPRCAKRSDDEIIAEVNNTIEAAVHRASPDAKVIAYDWGWKGHGDA